MPQYKSHLTAGAMTFIGVYLLQTKILHYPPYNQKTITISFFACLLGSLYPDIDTKSVGQKLFYSLLTIILVMTAIFSQWEIFAGLSFFGFAPLFARHRGFTHTGWFVLLTPFCMLHLICYTNPRLKEFAWPAYYYFTSGALSHLILDFGLWRFLKKLPW